MRKFVFTTALFFAVAPCYVQAESITFVDSSADTADWSFPEYEYTNGDLTDEYGTPMISDMIVTWDSSTGVLQNVTLNLHDSSSIQSFDSLFINTDYQPLANGSFNVADWDSWDYFVHSGGTLNYFNTDGDIPNNGLYSVADSYTYTTNSAAGRVGHPNGIDAGSLEYIEDFSRYLDSTNMQIVYDFTSLSEQIVLGDSFAFAYSPWCANDVVWGAFGTPSSDEVPEPTTLVLFGAGLIGLAALRKSKKQ